LTCPDLVVVKFGSGKHIDCRSSPRIIDLNIRCRNLVFTRYKSIKESNKPKSFYNSILWLY